jgi:hypothetical protein
LALARNRWRIPGAPLRVRSAAGPAPGFRVLRRQGPLLPRRRDTGLVGRPPGRDPSARPGSCSVTGAAALGRWLIGARGESASAFAAASSASASLPSSCQRALRAGRRWRADSRRPGVARDWREWTALQFRLRAALRSSQYSCHATDELSTWQRNRLVRFVRGRQEKTMPTTDRSYSRTAGPEPCRYERGRGVTSGCSSSPSVGILGSRF